MQGFFNNILHNYMNMIYFFAKFLDFYVFFTIIAFGFVIFFIAME